MQNSSSSDSLKPAAPGIPRRGLFTWRTLGRCLIALAILVTLIALFYAEEDWRGKRAWENYRREAEARGVNLDWQKLIPAPVPNDQNFAMTPFLAPLLDLNPRPFNGAPWRDTNGYNRAQSFATPLMRACDDARPRIADLREGQMTPLESIAAAMQKPEKSGASGTNLSRETAAAFILERMKSYQPVLDELRGASQRPYSRFNVHYDDEDPAGILLPHLAIIRKIATVLRIKASSELAMGKTGGAFEDVNLMLYLADSIRHESFIVSQLVRVAILNLARQIIWEGLSTHQWSDAQLQSFQTDLGKVSLLKEAQLGLQAERTAFGVVMYDLMRNKPAYLREVSSSWQIPGQPDAALILLSFAPNGWLYQEQITHQRIFDEKLMPLFDANGSQVHPQRVQSVSEEFSKPSTGAIHRLFHHEALVPLWMPALTKFCQKPAIGQTGVSQTIIACALERYRMANGKYPETLEALVPRYLDKIPVDVCSGQPMKYRRTDDGQFVLYSVGWNEKDDGGTVIMKNKNGAVDWNEGDWVWPPYK